MSDKEKNENQIYFIGCFFAALIVFNFLIVNSFADQCSTTDQICSDGLHPWYVFFMRFQTLITGVLAIVAAFITVGQMRKSDIRADSRHDDLMKLQMKGDIEDTKTLRDIFADQLNQQHNEYKRIYVDYRRRLAKEDISEEDAFLFFLGEIHANYDITARIANSDEWKNYQHVFSAAGRKYLSNMRKFNGRLRNQHSFCVDGGMLGVPRLKPGKFDENLVGLVKGNLLELQTAIRGLRDEVDFDFD